MVTQQTRPSIVAAEVYRKEIEVNLSESSIMMYCFEANTNVDQKLCRVWKEANYALIYWKCQQL